MDDNTSKYLARHTTRQTSYARDLTVQANPVYTELTGLANDAANSLFSLTVCERCAVPEAPFARKQAAKFARHAATATDRAAAAYAALVAGIFHDLAIKCGDVGEPLYEDEGEEEPAPMYVPEPAKWPSPVPEPQPVPA